MAGEAAVAATEPNPEIVDLATAEIKTAADKDSMANLLEASRESRIIGDNGPPPNEVEDEPEPEPEASGGEEGAPETKEAREKAEAEAATSKPPEFKPKHKSWEETEAARQEAERTMHEATTKAKQEAEAREALERERDELKQRLEEAAKPPEKPVEAVKPVTPASRKAKVAQALKTIRELDPQADDYDDKLAEAWAEAGMGAEGPSKEEIAKEAAKIARDELKAEQAADVAARAAAEQASAADRAWQEAVGIGQKAGLNLDDQDSADYIIFERMTSKIPEEMKGKPLAEIADWMVAETRKRTGQVVQTQAQREAAARKVQNENAVMGRGNERPAATVRKKEEENQLFTMRGILDQTLRQRRL